MRKRKFNPAPSSVKMSADELTEKIKACVREAMDEKADGASETDEPEMTSDVREVIEAAFEAAEEKRKSRKEAGEDVGDLTADEIIEEAQAILEEAAASEEEKEAEGPDEAEDDTDPEPEPPKRKSAQRPTQTKARKPAAPTAPTPAQPTPQRKYSELFSRAAESVERLNVKKAPPEIQLARAIKCLDVFGRHDPDAAAYFARKKYNDDKMAREFKALNATTPSSGGYLIPEVYLDEIIEMLYSKTVMFELGARKVPMPNGNLNIPKMTSGARATWGGEQRRIAKTQPTVANIRLSAKRLEAIIPQTRELLMSTNYSADQIFASDLTRRMELGLDYGGLFGTGSEFQPTGIVNNRDVETVDATALNNTNLASSAGVITADFPVWLVSKVMAKNVDDMSLGWTFNSFTEGFLKNMKTTTGAYIYREEMNGGKLLGFPYAVSNQIATDASNQTKIIFGNWVDMLVGEQLGLETYTTLDGSWVDEAGTQHNAFEENLAATRALMYVDVAVRHGESFIVVKNVKIA